MKKIYQITLLSLFLALASSCDEGFEELNMSKTGATNVDPVSVFNNAVILVRLPLQHWYMS